MFNSKLCCWEGPPCRLPGGEEHPAPFCSEWKAVGAFISPCSPLCWLAKGWGYDGRGLSCAVEGGNKARAVHRGNKHSTWGGGRAARLASLHKLHVRLGTAGIAGLPAKAPPARRATSV